MHGREDVRAQLKRKLESGRSIHMPAPRRIGKTWTINRLATDLRDAGWQAVEVDVEGISNPQQFARDLCVRIEGQISIGDRFKTHASRRLSNILGGNWGDRPLDAVTRVDPIEFAETLIAALDAATQKCAIIIDEIAYFFLAYATADAAGAYAFAYQLRALQQRYKNVRWVLTGSIGLDVIARRYGLQGAFTEFDLFILEPFTPDEARSYMRDPNVQQQFTHMFDASDEDFAAMFEELGWLAPYYLKLVANEVRPSLAREGGMLPLATRADFTLAFDRLLQPNRRSAFAVWREHVEKNLPQDDIKIALKILDWLSETSAGELEETLVARATADRQSVSRRQIADILAMLENDGLIGNSAARYAFRSGLIRRYWAKYEVQ